MYIKQLQNVVNVHCLKINHVMIFEVTSIKMFNPWRCYIKTPNLFNETTPTHIPK